MYRVSVKIVYYAIDDREIKNICLCMTSYICLSILLCGLTEMSREELFHFD